MFMTSKVLDDGVIVVRPTREEVLGLKVGDRAINVFGKIGRIVEIFARGLNVDGRAYACTYIESASGLRISHSFCEGEVVPTIPVISRFSRVDSIRWDDLVGSPIADPCPCDSCPDSRGDGPCSKSSRCCYLYESWDERRMNG